MMPDPIRALEARGEFNHFPALLWSRPIPRRAPILLFAIVETFERRRQAGGGGSCARRWPTCIGG